MNITATVTVAATASPWSTNDYANAGACRKAARRELGADAKRGTDYEIRKTEAGRWEWCQLTIVNGAAEAVLTCEEWLREASERLHTEVFTPVYVQAFETDAPAMPDFRISRGFPRGSRKAIGQCWSTTASTDGHTEMFISPVLSCANQEDATHLLQVVAHEMVHMLVGPEHGHKAPFARVARAIGLEGKLTATTAGEAFKGMVEPMLADMPAYPAAAMSPMDLDKKKQKTYLLKVTCTDEECGTVLRLTQKVVDKGAERNGEDSPLCCPVCQSPVEIE